MVKIFAVLLSVFLLGATSAMAEVLADVDASATPLQQNMTVFLPPSHKPQPPSSLVQCLKIVNVEYFDDKGQLRAGRMVVNRDLVKDIEEIFSVIKALKFPIRVMALASDSPYNWSDEELMKAGATSAYNYRLKTGGSGLSSHALGRAIDINTACNPYVKYGSSGSVSKVEPQGAVYNPSAKCAISRETEAGRRIIDEFTKRGWKWGGDWANPKDYQHFERKSPNGVGAPYCE